MLAKLMGMVNRSNGVFAYGGVTAELRHVVMMLEVINQGRN